MKYQRDYRIYALWFLLTVIIATLYVRISFGPSTIVQEYYRIAVDALNAGNNEEAITYATHVLDLRPDDALFYYGRGLAYYAKKDFANSLKDYSIAINHNSNYAPAYYSRAMVYHEQGDFEQAFLDYSEAIRLLPDFADAYYGRGTTYFNQGDYGNAIIDYSKGITLKPTYVEAFYARALAYQALGKKEEALKDLREALDVTSDVSWRAEIARQIQALEEAP